MFLLLSLKVKIKAILRLDIKVIRLLDTVIKTSDLLICLI